MRIEADMMGLRGLLDEEYKRLGKDTREAVTAATDGLKRELRQQVSRAGLGIRLGNAWRSRVYRNDPDGLTTAGFVWSRAPDIILSYDRGTVISPIGGRRYLWLPTKSVPWTGGGSDVRRRRMNPHEVERAIGPFIIREGKGGRKLALIAKDRGRTKADKLRKVRKGRLGHGAAQELVLMFNLIPTTRRAKLLDIDGAAQRWAGAVVRMIEQG